MPLTLITIPPSHYCEKARWALERASVRYTEERHPPILHWASTFRANRQRTVPILVTPHGCIGESTQIVKFADRALSSEMRLYPDDSELCRDVESSVMEFDRVLGPATRRVIYFYALQQPDLLIPVLTSGVRWLDASIYQAGYKAFFQAMRKGMKIDAQGVERSFKKLDSTFAEVERRLADGRRFLFGDRFTAADLTFASLVGPLLSVPHYGCEFPLPERWGDQMKSVMAKYRATVAGRFVVRLFEEERRKSVTS